MSESPTSSESAHTNRRKRDDSSISSTNSSPSVTSSGAGPMKQGRRSVTFATNTHPPQENSLAISVTKHEHVKFPEHFVEYTVFVHEGGHPVKVLLRRYRQFEKLHLDIRRESVALGIAEHLLPDLPKKRWFSKQRWLNRWDESFQFERRLRLQEYVRSLARLPALHASAGLIAFLELEGQGGKGDGGSCDGSVGNVADADEPNPQPEAAVKASPPRATTRESNHWEGELGISGCAGKTTTDRINSSSSALAAAAAAANAAALAAAAAATRAETAASQQGKRLSLEERLQLLAEDSPSRSTLFGFAPEGGGNGKSVRGCASEGNSGDSAASIEDRLQSLSLSQGLGGERIMPI